VAAKGDIWLPQSCDPTRDYSKVDFANGDVVVVSGDKGNTYQIGPKKYVSKGTPIVNSAPAPHQPFLPYLFVLVAAMLAFT
jgi:hypothetical protein